MADGHARQAAGPCDKLPPDQVDAATPGEPMALTAISKSEAELKRRAVRQSALRSITRHGMLRATVRGLSGTAHRSGRSLNEHCSEHEALIAEIMVAHLDTLMRRVCDAYDQTATQKPVKRLEAITGAFLASALDERNEHRLIVRSGDVLDETGQVSVIGRYRSLATLFAEVIEASAPNVTPASGKLAAMSLLTTLSGAALWFRDDGAIEAAAFAQMLAETAMTMARPSVQTA